MEAVVERLSRSPRLPHIVRELSAFWEKERTARKAFYDSIEDGQKIEFIHGEIIVHSPDAARHIEASKCITTLLHAFVTEHGLGRIYHEKALVSLTRNDYMPDVNFYSAQKAAEFVPTQLQFPAPDLTVEILSPSTQRRDRGVKFADYAAHGVEEYWIVDPEARTVERYRLTPLGEYACSAKVSGDQSVLSEVLPGFKVPARAFFDNQANLAALRKLLG